MMKHTLHICCSLLLLCCQSNSTRDQIAQAQEQSGLVADAKPSTSASEPASKPAGRQAFAEGEGPRIAFAETRQSFGEIWHAERSHHTYQFTNEGNADLLITSARASCGCTKPTFPTQPFAPGESGSIDVTYNSVGKQGAQRATIYLRTNDPTQPEVQLKLTGRVKVKPKEEYDKEQAARKKESSQP